MIHCSGKSPLKKSRLKDSEGDITSAMAYLRSYAKLTKSQSDETDIKSQEMTMSLLVSKHTGGFNSKVINAHDAKINHLAFAPDDKSIASAFEDKTAKIWEIETGKLRHVLRHKAPIRHIVYSNDGKSIVTSSEDNTATISSLRAGVTSSSASMFSTQSCLQ